MKLTKEEWNQLDSLLGKIGFGGYYDFMEVQRQSAYNLIHRIEDKDKQTFCKEMIRSEKDLKTLTMLINFLSKGDIKK